MVPLSVVIYLSLCVLPFTLQDAPTTPITTPVASSLIRTSPRKQARPILFKRSPPLFPGRSQLQGRILTNKKSPLNVLQNGPYYINHYIYCDNLDQHTLDHIKSETYHTDKHIQLLNLHKDKFHRGLTPNLDALEHGTYSGDKEIHVLHIPKDKPHNFDDIKLHLSLLNAHLSPEAPDIDLDVNKHLGSFEVSLDTIKPPTLDSSSLPGLPTSYHRDVVKPLFQGHVTGGHVNLEEATQYYREGAAGSSGHQGGGKEILDLPHFEKYPLENDSSKLSYDSPGAVDSYGQPVSTSYQNQNDHFLNTGNNNQLDLVHLQQPGGVSYGFQSTNNVKTDELYFNELSGIHDFHRKRRQESRRVEGQGGEKVKESGDVRHPNHRYD